MLDARGRLLRAALGLLSLEPREPELRLLHQRFDDWRGIGDVVAGMARAEYDLEPRRYDGHNGLRRMSHHHNRDRYAVVCDTQWTNVQADEKRALASIVTRRV